MTLSITLHDPFLNKDVQISHKLTDRLRGRYACGPTMASGEPEFGWREFETPPVQHEAADEIDRLREMLVRAYQFVSPHSDPLPITNGQMAKEIMAVLEHVPKR